MSEQPLPAHERISAAIRCSTAAGRTALVPYITAGYPQKERFIASVNCRMPGYSKGL